jgi:predicted phosphodiesterase
MRLLAISDLHVGYAENRRVVEELPANPGDWLILAGDLCETIDDLEFVLKTLAPRFAKLVWVPGNHELWTVADSRRGQAKYEQAVAVCRKYGALTPEDPYEVFDPGGAAHLLIPLFTLYDYSFAPPGMGPDEALLWALADGLVCADEHFLDADPYPSRQAWCAERCALSEARMVAALAGHDGPTVLVNHFPLRRELAHLPLIPRFQIWCGTERTRDWAERFRASVVVYGHLHMRGTRWIDGVRFEEVSLGYPRQWQGRGPARREARQILPPVREL